MLECCFAVWADRHEGPSALFSDLEDAIGWGLDHFGSDNFSIRHCPVREIEGVPRSS